MIVIVNYLRFFKISYLLYIGNKSLNKMKHVYLEVIIVLSVVIVVVVVAIMAFIVFNVVFNKKNLFL